MDDAKVGAIKEWEVPTKVIELRSFFRLTNYYHRFISGYSTKSALLTELLKKNKSWVWNEQYKKAFKDLKVVIMKDGRSNPSIIEFFQDIQCAHRCLRLCHWGVLM